MSSQTITTAEQAQAHMDDAERRSMAHYKAGDMTAFHAACRDRETAEKALHKAEQLSRMEPGMGGSTCCWTDHHPVTVSRCTAKSVWVRDDGHKLRSGSAQDGSAEYLFILQPDAPEHGPYRWSDKLQSFAHKGTRLHLGTRSRYYDPSF